MITINISEGLRLNMISSKYIAIICSLLLVACSHTPQRDAGQVRMLESSAADQRDAERERELAAMKLPNVELTDQILYQFLLGDIAVQRDQMELATEAYLELAKSTRDPRLARHASHLAFETRQVDKMMEASQVWQELEPDSVRAKQMLAAMLLTNEKIGKARPIVLEILADNPAHAAEVFMQLYPMLSRYPDKNAAYELMHELSASYPAVAEGKLLVAQLAEASGKHEIALEEARMASKLRPEWDAAVLLNAQLQQQETPQKSVTLVKDYLVDYPDNKEVRLYYARLLTELKQHREARTQFQLLLDEVPDNPDLAFAVALLSLELGEFDRAESGLQIALRNGKKDESAVHYYLGQLNEAKNADEAALQSYRKVQSGEYAFPAQLRLAYLLNKTGKLMEARQQLQQAHADNDQQRAQLIMLEAKILRDAKQPEAAYQVLFQGLDKMPDSPDLLYEAGMLVDQMGQHETFERMVRKLIQLRPDYAHGYNALGYSLLDRNVRVSEGMQLVEKAFRLAPDDPAIMDSVGWGHYRMGDLSKSEEFLRRAYTANPDPEIAAHLGEVLWVRGDKEEAKKVWQQAFLAHSDNAVLAAVMKKFLP